MAEGPERAFYVQGWMTRATYAIAAIQLVGSIFLAVFGRTLGVGPILPSLFAFGAVLTGYQAFWTSRTPIAIVDDHGVRLRPALLSAQTDLAFTDIRAFARIPPGWLVFLARDGEETRVPLTALSSTDADALVDELMQHLTEVSYIEG